MISNDITERCQAAFCFGSNETLTIKGIESTRSLLFLHTPIHPTLTLLRSLISESCVLLKAIWNGLTHWIEECVQLSVDHEP